MDQTYILAKLQMDENGYPWAKVSGYYRGRYRVWG